jgi:glyoxylase-like metal-dependent hydrolase (beta-lactamase superfamily II)
MKTRRWINNSCMVAMFAIHVVSAHAAAPMAKNQAPGFYRMMLGDFEVTALNDCVVPYTISTLPGATPQQIKNGLSEMRLTSPVGMSYNAFLINTGKKLLLIDTGTGGKLDDDPGFHGCGRLPTNLLASGYEPGQIDEIYISHVGPDHVGGLTLGAERAYPNAIVRAAKSEVDIYVDPEKTAAALANAEDKAQAKQWFEFQSGLFSPYIKAGKFQTFEGDVTLSPGIRALATPGHTPGHTSYVVESEGQTLIVLGDLVHWASVQFRYPSAYTSFDADPKAATAQRLRVLKMAADKGDWVAGAHLAFPGIGHIRAGEGRYFWIPANYTIP